MHQTADCQGGSGLGSKTAHSGGKKILAPNYETNCQIWVPWHSQFTIQIASPEVHIYTTYLKQPSMWQLSHFKNCPEECHIGMILHAGIPAGENLASRKYVFACIVFCLPITPWFHSPPFNLFYDFSFKDFWSDFLVLSTIDQMVLYMILGKINCERCISWNCIEFSSLSRGSNFGLQFSWTTN